jgi:hypothetical protein
MEIGPKLLKTARARIWRSKKMENRNILNFPTLNIQRTYKEDQLDEIFSKENL